MKQLLLTALGLTLILWAGTIVFIVGIFLRPRLRKRREARERFSRHGRNSDLLHREVKS